MNFEGLTITIGCPGAGKSTWADANLPETVLRLERDRFRECLFGTRRAYHNHHLAHSVRSNVITHLMREAMATWPYEQFAVTDTGLVYDALHPFIDMIPGFGTIRLVIFERTPEYLRMNNRIRPEAHRIPDDILEEMIAKFDDPKAWWRQPPWDQLEKAYV